jgi:hypothetical protein
MKEKLKKLKELLELAKELQPIITQSTIDRMIENKKSYLFHIHCLEEYGLDIELGRCNNRVSYHVKKDNYEARLDLSDQTITFELKHNLEDNLNQEIFKEIHSIGGCKSKYRMGWAIFPLNKGVKDVIAKIDAICEKYIEISRKNCKEKQIKDLEERAKVLNKEIEKLKSE